MRIVIIINQLGIGGAERLVVDEANELYRRGIPFTLVTLKPERGNSYLRDCRFPKSDFVCIPFASLLDWRGWVTLVKLLRVQKPDTVITHLWFSNTIGRIAAFIACVPHIISFEHNVYDSVKTHKQFFIDRILQSLSSQIIAVSSAVRDSLMRHGISAKRVIVLANGIDLSRYQSAVPSDIRTEKNLGNAFLFLYVGRLIHQKGVDILLDAFAQVDTGHLLIAGDGVDRAALEQQAAQLGISNRVSFLGVRNDIPGLMKAADCFVLASRWEGVGIVLFEAIACNLPIVVSNFPATKEIFTNYNNALIVTIDDAPALATAMSYVQNNETVRNQLRGSNQEMKGSFNIAKHVDLLLSYAI